MSGDKIFWMMIERSADGEYKQPVESSTEVFAQTIAGLMARSNPGTRYYVVKAQDYFESADVLNMILLQTNEENTDG